MRASSITRSVQRVGALTVYGVIKYLKSNIFRARFQRGVVVMRRVGVPHEVDRRDATRIDRFACRRRQAGRNMPSLRLKRIKRIIRE